MGSELGTEWRVETVVSVTDGDTVRLRRSRVIELDGRTYRITDEEPRGVSIRLTWVDTPERGDAGYKQAHDDLANWVQERGHAMVAKQRQPLRVVCYESGGWDRLMGDLLDADGNSASQWLMTEGNNGAGWPAYVKGQ